MIDLSLLNEVQRNAVLDTEGQVLVFAGAGSGKTRVLTHRIAYIVDSDKARPFEVLAITFTNKAANEMKERLAKMIGGAEQMWICTIHSMCTRILRSDIDKLGYTNNFSIYSDTERNNVIKRIIADNNFDKDDDDGMLKRAKWHISNAKTWNIEPAEYYKLNIHAKNIDEICKIYGLYEQELKQSNALDFDDLLTKTYVLLKENPSVCEKFASRFKYIHVDEFQDTNEVQYKIVQLLASVHNNIFVVGDDDQSIYSWRGAKVENILNFGKDYPQAKIYKLEQNYRSTKKILAVANQIIQKNSRRAPKELFCEGSEGVKPEFYSGYDETAEARYVAEQVYSLTHYSGYDYKDIAVLYRLNSLSRAFEQEFNSYNIPYAVYGGLKFYDRKEIKDLIAYIRIAVNTNDDEAIARIINVPKRGIGATTVEKLRAIAFKSQASIFSVLESVATNDAFNAATRAKLSAFYDLLSVFIEKAKELNPFDFTEFVINTTAFTAQYNSTSEEDYSRVQNIAEFQHAQSEFIEENPDCTIVDFLQSVSLTSDLDEDHGDNTVKLSTVHAAKGLEFKTVFIVGLDETIFPIIKDDGDLEEERRLMYVAVTRAMERLYLTRADSRYSVYTRERNYTMASRFLSDISDLIGNKFKKKEYNDDYGGYKKSYDGAFTGSKPSSVSNVNVSSDLGEKKNIAVGDSVSHPKFGIGTVLSMQGSGDQTVIDVQFSGFGKKSLALKYAPIKKI